MFKGAGFLILDSPFPAGRFRSVLIFARGVFRKEEKPAPFTKTVKRAAPENSTLPKTWPTRHSKGPYRTQFRRQSKSWRGLNVTRH
jgi:hypothetical protein